MAEKHGFEAPEGHRLCANNCGFMGSPTTMNLCSKCYQAIQFDSTQPISGSGTDSGYKLAPESSSGLKLPGLTEVAQATILEPRAIVEPTGRANRCLACRKRAGLTGFKCRCGWVFCGSHRYPENHECGFDYKKVGKEAIAKANPVVKAAKLDKI